MDAEEEEEEEGRWASAGRPPLPPTQMGGRHVRRGHAEFTQPIYHRPHQPHRHPPPPPSSSAYFFLQPGEPEFKSTHAFSQVDHAPSHTHQPRKRVDVMTGEHRQFRSSSFAPNHPSQHHNHHGNVELIGHKPLRPTRSHGYGGVEYKRGQQQIPYSRIGMGNGFLHADDSPVEWEVRAECVCVCIRFYPAFQ